MSVAVCNACWNEARRIHASGHSRSVDGAYRALHQAGWCRISGPTLWEEVVAVAGMVAIEPEEESDE